MMVAFLNYQKAKKIEPRRLNIKKINFSLRDHEQLEINDLNQLLQVKHYYEENARKRDLMKEHPEKYVVLNIHDETIHEETFDDETQTI